MLTEQEWLEVCRAAGGTDHTGDACDALKAAVEAIIAAREGVWRAPIEALAARIERLHPEMLGWCQGCAHESYPCRTLLALRAALGSVSAPGNEAGQ